MPFDPFGSSSNSSSTSQGGFKGLIGLDMMYQKHFELEEESGPGILSSVLQHQHHQQSQHQPEHLQDYSPTAQQQRQQHGSQTASLPRSRPPIPKTPPSLLSPQVGGAKANGVRTNGANTATPGHFTSSTSTYPLLPPPPCASSRLPPKSPASMNSNSSQHAAARRILLETSSRSYSNNSSRKGKSSGRSRSRSRDRNNRRARSRSNGSNRERAGRRNSNTSFDSSASSETDDTDHDDYDDRSLSSSFSRLGRNRGREPSPPNIQDPTPDHLRVETDTDDLSNAPDFSLITFEPKPTTNVSTSQNNVLARGSSNNVVTGQPVSVDRLAGAMAAGAESTNADSLVSAATGVSFGKSCLVIPKLSLRRGKNQRVQVADVASVGGYSDTLVSLNSNLAAGVWQSKPGGRITGRELHETAKSFLNDGDYEQALHLFEVILKAQQDRFGGVKHSSVGAALHNVGVVRLRMAEYEVAEEVLLQALAVRRSVLGNEHLDLAATLAKLGSARSALGKFDEGLGDLRAALQITRKVLGRTHRAVAQILCHIACLYFEAGEMFSAQATFEDALEIYREIFQKEELADRDAVMAQLTETLCNIGSIQNKRRNFEGAIESFREAVELQQGIMGHDHPRVIASLDNLGYSFSKSKSYNQALACYRQMLTAQISHFGELTMECCDTLKKQIVIFGKLQNKQGAIKAVASYLESAKTRSDQNDPIVVELEQMLVDLQSVKKRTGRSKARKAEKGDRRRDRSLDCFDRILFDRKSRLCEF